MIESLLADLLVLFHLTFIIFIICGGFLTVRWRFMIWLHIPCAVWGALIEFSGWICPLTPLENHLRNLAGRSGYHSGFIEHYILPVIYPAELTRELQYMLGAGVLVINLCAYGLLIYLKLKKRKPQI